MRRMRDGSVAAIVDMEKVRVTCGWIGTKDA